MIWCVEDDSGIREIEVYTLNSTGFQARGFADGASFREALETETPELVLLDVMLPGEDGVSLLRYLRQTPRTQAVPVIMALDGHTVTAAGERVTLTYKEFELLRLFLSHPGMAFTRDQLFNDVWGADYVGESRTVDMHIRTLRQKLGACGDRIETVRGVGYRWEARP